MDSSATARRPLRYDAANDHVSILDQTLLPHEEVWITLATLSDAASAISEMRVRGAPLIGVVAAYGVALAMREDASDRSLARAARALVATRPTAINLSWAVDRVVQCVSTQPPADRRKQAYAEAQRIADEEAARCSAIGDHGAPLIVERARAHPGRPVQVLTHCNAGYLATFEWGTALAPIYKAHAAGVAVHVWVDETRPLDQGSRLTAWELERAGVPHTVIVDNAGGHLMQLGEVDLCLVGSDRTTARGDVCNKIGTYLKAVAARDCGVPFYVALPSSTIDWQAGDGLAEIPIESRGEDEVRLASGRGPDGVRAVVHRFAADTPVHNPAFDVTPARLVDGLITEHGVFPASPEGLEELRLLL